MHLFVFRPHNVPLVLALVLGLLDDVSRVGAAIHDVLALFFASYLNVAGERLRHGNDVRVRLVPGDGVGEAFGAFLAFDGEGPEEGTEEGDELGLRKVDAGTGTVAVAE